MVHIHQLSELPTVKSQRHCSKTTGERAENFSRGSEPTNQNSTCLSCTCALRFRFPRVVMASMASIPTPRQRKRKVCVKCGQKLSHAAYVRHQNPLVCSGETVQPKKRCGEPASTSPEEAICGMEPTVHDDEELQHCVDEDVHTDNETDVESEADDVEIVSDCEDDQFGTGSESCGQSQSQFGSPEASPFGEHKESSKSPQKLQIIATHLCLFITFFQLCYRVPERGITLLLSFVRALLLWIGNYLGNSDQLLLLCDMIPKNVYFLKKNCSFENGFYTYVVCPKCHTLYDLKDCIIKKRNGTNESARCTYNCALPKSSPSITSRTMQCFTHETNKIRFELPPYSLQSLYLQQSEAISHQALWKARIFFRM